MSPHWLLLWLVAVAADRSLNIMPQVSHEEVRADGADDLGFSATSGESTATVKRLWGVSDATARAGRLFVHAIDKDAFYGDVARFEVGGSGGGDQLPDWLTFDPATATFSGVPLADELGPHLITVRAIGADGLGSARDRFMVDVVLERDAEPVGLAAGLDEESGRPRCPAGAASTVLSLYLESAAPAIQAAQRLSLLHSVAGYLQLEPEALEVTSGGGGGGVPLEGPGPGQGGALTVLSAVLGCSGRVEPSRRPAVAAVRADPGLARLAAVTGRSAVGWQLTERPTAGRRRRQAPDGSGGWPDDDDYSYNYGDDYGDYDSDYDDYGDEPPSRPEPSMASPLPGGGVPSSPVQRPPPVSAFGARMSTPIPIPVQPTPYQPRPLEPSVESGRPAPASGQLESSMFEAGGPVQATSLLPEGAAAAPPNYPPHLKQHMRKQLLVAGKEFRVRVPEQTFEDFESGPTRQLALTLRRTDGQPLGADHWLQFDAERQDIYGLPLEEHVGEYEFELTATDAGGLTATEHLSVVVRLYQQWRAINHRFHLTFQLVQPAVFTRTVDWQLLLLHRLAKLLDQSSTASLLVYDVRSIDGSFRLSWVNNTVSTHRCDKLALAQIALRLLAKDGAPTPELRQALLPEFSSTSVRLELVNVCRGVELAALPAPATEPPRRNRPPERLRRLDRISAAAGKLLALQVPADTFFDEEDGDAREMELRLLTSERQPVTATSWLQFEPKNQEFVGLPLDDDVGRSYYHLECMDSGGLKVLNSIEVEVKPRLQNDDDFTVEFGVTLDNNFTLFDGDMLQKQRLMEKLAELLGDSDPDAMLVHSILPGSVLFSWLNESLPRDVCPDAEIAGLRAALLDDMERVQPSAVRALGPEFRLRAARVTPRGLCLAGSTPTAEPTPPPAAAGPADQPAPEGRGDEYLVTFIVPAVVIAAMLVIAGLIACVLHRARRRGKMAMTATGSGTYVSRGIPVIFSDELEDRMEKNAKTPVILSNEQPPEPPTYPADGGSSAATPMLDDRSEDAPYERPPPFAGAGESGRAGRAKAVSNYRQPPPYVPP